MGITCNSLEQFEPKCDGVIEINGSEFYKKLEKKKEGLELVDFNVHQEKIEKLANNRSNSHLKSYLEGGYNLTMFYYGSVFKDGISYIKELDTYLCYEIEDEE